MSTQTRPQKESVARQKEAQEQAIKDKGVAEAKEAELLAEKELGAAEAKEEAKEAELMAGRELGAAEAKEAKEEALNPDHRRVEAGAKKIDELEAKEEALVDSLFSIRQEKARVIKSIQGSRKQATLAACLKQMKNTERAHVPGMSQGVPNVQPMLPGALTAAELKAQAKK